MKRGREILRQSGPRFSGRKMARTWSFPVMVSRTLFGDICSSSNSLNFFTWKITFHTFLFFFAFPIILLQYIYLYVNTYMHTIYYYSICILHFNHYSALEISVMPQISVGPNCKLIMVNNCHCILPLFTYVLMMVPYFTE